MLFSTLIFSCYLLFDKLISLTNLFHYTNKDKRKFNKWVILTVPFNEIGGFFHFIFSVLVYSIFSLLISYKT